MKRFLSIFLTAAMLLSTAPMTFADEVTDENKIIAVEESAAEPSDDENIEEQADMQTEKNEIALFADDSSEYEVQYSINGSTWIGSTLAEAVTAIGTGTGTIKVLNDVTVSAEIKITGNVILIADGKDVTIKRASTFVEKKDSSGWGANDVYAHLFSVENGATLTLGTSEESQNNLIIDGGAIWPDTYPDKNINKGPHQSINNDASNNSGLKSTGCLIVNDGTLNMYNGVVLQNNHNITEFDYAGTAVINHKIFNMYVGKIWKNSSFSVDGLGGAVANGVGKKKVYNDAVFNMYGGEISYNAAGVGAAVTVGNVDVHTSTAKFTMFGGVITKNYTAGNETDAGEP